MLGNLNQSPASTRPKYALEAPNTPSEGGNPFKKGLMLALMAVAAGLFLVLPDGDGDVTAIATEGTDGTSAEYVEPETPSASQPDSEADSEADFETEPDSDASTPYRQEVSSGAESADDVAADAEATAKVAIATEAALAGMEHSLSSGSAISAMGELMEGLRSESTTTSTAPPAPSTTESTEPATTEAPTTTIADTTTTAGEDASTTTSVTENAGDETANDPADGGEAPEAETTVPPTTAAPETTAAPDTTVAPAGNDGWIDAGHGVLVPQVLLDIRYCESRDRYDAANPSSSARGAYQFLTGSWDAYGHKDRYGVNQAHLASAAQQDEAAVITWERDGTRPWNASKSCWANR
jgi:hypothetical protein